MSDSEVVVVNKRKTNRLILDSEEEARLEAQEHARQEEIRLRKEQKRRRKEEQARREEEEAKRKLELIQKYQNPQTMLLEDSNSQDSFSRVEKKIRKAYPEFRGKEQTAKRRHVSESQDSDSEDSEDESEQSQSSSKHKKKAEKKTKKEKRVQRRHDEEEDAGQPRQKVERVKIEEKDPKERFIKQIAIRWWYCLPEWPDSNYSYEDELKKLGYRLVEQNRFRMEQNLVNGLLKATTVDGYPGVFRTKLKIIDIRPKESAPSIRFLRSKSMEELAELLATALKEQIAQLQEQRYHQSEDLQLLQILQKRLKELG